MKAFIPELIAICLSGILFMTISMKFRLNMKLWLNLNKRIKSKYNFIIWFIFACALFIIVLALFDIIGLSYNRIINGIIFSFSLTFMPRKDEKKE